MAITPKMTPARRKHERSLRAEFQAKRPSLAEVLADHQFAGPIDGSAYWGLIKVVARLRRVREERGLSQRELAEKVGMDVTALSRIESGRQTNLTFATLARLAAGLKCDLKITLAATTNGKRRKAG